MSRVFQNIDPPLPLASVSSPRTKGVHNRRALWGVNIWEDERHRIGLLQYNLFPFDPVPPRNSVRPRGDDRTDFSLPYGRLLRAARDSGDREDVQLNYILKITHKLKFNIL